MSEDAEDTSLLETARKRHKFASEAWDKQRIREKEDLEYQIPENQWTPQARKEREGRPTLSIDRISQPRQLILNQMRSAQLGVQIHPVSEDADDDGAEVRQGIYRHIERNSRAAIARYWAFDRATTAGTGAYMVLTEYDEDSDVKGDQKIVVKRILHQDGVLFDPSAQEPDFSDGHFVFIESWLSRDEFKRQFPKAKVPEKGSLEWESAFSEAPDWFRDEDVLTVWYWWKEFDKDGTVRKIHCDKLCSWEALEEETFPGKLIPIIPVVGKELQPYDAERHWVGMIRPMKDGQELYNFAASSLVESMAAEPKAPWVLVPEQIEGYEEWWDHANTRNFTRLPYKPVVKDGLLVPPPQRTQVDSSKMQLSLMALQQADQFLMATSATFEASQGRLSQKERSGKAILALQQQSDSGNSHFLQNYAEYSLPYEARVILGLMPIVYDRPGRVTHILRGDDDKTEAVILNKPFIVDPQTKRPKPYEEPKPAPPGMSTSLPPRPPMAGPQGAAPGPAPMAGPPQPPPQPKHYDLTKGKYSVAVSVGKSFQTRLQEGSAMIGELLGNKPELFMPMADIYLKFQDWPGHEEMAKRMRRVIGQQYPGLLDEGQAGQPSPDQLKAQIEGMGRQMQAMTQQLQAAVQAIQTKQAEQAAKIQIAEMERDTKLRISAADNETKLAIAGMEKKVETLLELLNLERESRHVEAAQAHEAEQAELQRQHEAGQSEQAAANDERMGMQQRQHEAAMNELQRSEPEPPQMGGMEGE